MNEEKLVIIICFAIIIICNFKQTHFIYIQVAKTIH